MAPPLRNVVPLFALALLVGSTGCGMVFKGVTPRTTIDALPKPEAPLPRQVAPPFVPELAPGEGIVVVDTPQDDSRVNLVLKETGTALKLEGEGTIGGHSGVVSEETKLLCTRTPCAFKLPVGAHRIAIESPAAGAWPASTDRIDLDVAPKPVRVTHLMSRGVTTTEPPAIVGSILFMSLGSMLLPLAILPVALGSPEAGAVMAVGGIGCFAADYLLYDPGSTHTKLKPGATTISGGP